VGAGLLTGVAIAIASAEAAVSPASRSAIVSFRDARLDVPDTLHPVGALTDVDTGRLLAELGELGVAAESALYDVYAGRWGSLVLSRPLIPGDGAANALSWASLDVSEPPQRSQVEKEAWAALVRYLEASRVLRVEVSELSPVTVTVHDGGALVQIHAQRTVKGIRVRDAALSAVIGHGNLVLLGLSRWIDIEGTPRVGVGPDAARALVGSHLAGRLFTTAAPRLELVPLRKDLAAAAYELKPAWSIAVTVMGDHGTWEALVDAEAGGLLAFEDRNVYSTTRRIVGGVYPVSNDGLPPDGIEQPGFPMPFADVLLPAGGIFTNGQGVFGCFPATGPGLRRMMTTTLSGRYAAIADGCGPIMERWLIASEPAGDLGHGPGTDCAVPPGHSAGDTHAARTAFYEVNRIAEQGRGYLPANSWLQAPLPVNVNVAATCGASWNGTSLNFFRGGAACRNPGEVAGAIDHEWGHGMDDNGANPTLSNPAESMGDIHAILRLDRSCVGRGFLTGSTCGGYGDPCTECTGVRDLDWAKHASGLPHDIAWVQTRCPSGTSVCGRQVHCASVIVSEAFWDLRARDLPSLFGFDDNTSLELATRLAYLGGGFVSTWYACTPPAGGCGATGGYLNLLAADDDNGNLADGTPHMAAIHAAFDRHQIACATPAPVNSGCAGGPATPALVTATPRDGAVALSWTAVPGAARYAVFRTEGVNGCVFGKTKIGETTGTAFDDPGLLNGFTYFYSVMPVGANASCLGPMSACEQAIPSGPGACLPTAETPR
jgi:hypothetical protein